MRSVKRLAAAGAVVVALTATGQVTAAAGTPSVEATKETITKVRKALAKLGRYTESYTQAKRPAKKVA